MKRGRTIGAMVVGAFACAWLRQPAFTVTGASPDGFPPPAQKPRAEIPRAPTRDLANNLGGDAEVMFTRDEYLYRKDNGHKFPVGEEAYQYPPPIPDERAGLNFPTLRKSHCDRVYQKKFMVCQRLKENRRRRADCEYDAFRWRRSCYWKCKPYKIHPNFNKDHAWHKKA